MPRTDKAAETRDRLLRAAAEVVGIEGYANASVAKITARAEVAQGTFYNYFASQQDLFDHLLPDLGAELLEFIRGRVHGRTDSLEREEAGFRAFFEFLQQRPEFYGILNEAEVFAPKAFRAHMHNMADGYLRALGRSHAKGELPGFERRELDVVIYTLLAARNYIAYRYGSAEGRPLPAWVTDAYMKLVSGGILHGGTDRKPARGKRRSQSAQQRAIDGGSWQVTSRKGDTAILHAHVGADAKPLSASRLVPLAQRAAQAAAEEAAGRALALTSFSMNMIRIADGETLVARARIATAASAVHVTVEIDAVGAPGPVLATAQAAYTFTDPQKD